MAGTTLRLGLTGGIGSGKSTVANMLAQFGASVIDADAISRSVTAPKGAAIAAIRAEFGPQMIDIAGALDREKMRALVYSDPDARRRLEAIVHPRVGQISAQQVQASVLAGSPCIVFDIPLLVESGRWRQQLDNVLVIDCPPDLQIERVMNRSGLSWPTVESIVASQASRQGRLRAADSVLFNGSVSMDTLADQVRQLACRFGLSSPAGPAEISA